MLVPDASQDGHGPNHRIRRVDISTGATTTLAGSGVAGVNDDNVGTSAQFNHPTGIAIAPDGAFALVTVRAWPPAPRVSWPSPPQRHTCLAHTPHSPTGLHRRLLRSAARRHTHTALPAFAPLAQRVLAPDASQDYSSSRLRRVDITTGATTTLAGSVAGFNDDVGTNAQFKLPWGVAIDPSGSFALVGVRAWPPARSARRGLPPRSGAPASHTRLTDPHRRPLRCGGHRHTPRRRLAPHLACARV